MAAVIARALEGDLDVVLVHKLGAPGAEELAIGAVDEDGRLYVDREVADLGVGEGYIEAERQKQWRMLLQRRELYTQARRALRPEGRTVIVVDNGIATGATLIAALRAVRGRGPARLIAAAAVAPAETVRRLEREADEVVVVEQPREFFAVGAFFRDFHQVSDDEVVQLLERHRAAAEGGGGTRGSRADPPAWEHFPHDADIGVRGRGATVAEAFEQAALALTAVVTEPTSVREEEHLTIERESAGVEDLFYDWMNALVYEMAVRKLLFSRYQVNIEGPRLRATAWGERVDVARHQPAVEIKGATYTELRVAREPDGAWIAQCVVDV
jgi:predicted phosphoribosyltransferase/SHS2 domain-containing protein